MSAVSAFTLTPCVCVAGGSHGVESRGRAFAARATATVTMLQHARLVSIPATLSYSVWRNNRTHNAQANPEQRNVHSVEHSRSLCFDRLLVVHCLTEPNTQGFVAIAMNSFWVFVRSNFGKLFDISAERFAQCVQA